MKLMPPDFSLLSLKEALAQLCVKFSLQTGIECVRSIESELSFASISPENQLHLYRMVQESFNNIAKHSQSGKATLVARRSFGSPYKRESPDRRAADKILICISDEGIGLVPGADKPDTGGSGLGMMSMRQRAAIVGAMLDFISESGYGLMVRIEIPCCRNSSTKFPEYNDG
jgi:two-component system NarL family sensor kinase